MASVQPASGGPARQAELLAWVEAGLLSPADALARLRTRVAQAGARAAAPAASNVPPRAKTPAAAEDREAAVAAVLVELDGLVGLETVKRTVRQIHAHTRVQQWRAEHGLRTEPVCLHMVFTGHPGTGKTTVARVLGRLFQAVGLLGRGHLTEVDRADLVGEYIGHTAQRTREAIRRALGGVLFVDEAYSLARGGEKDFGKEAIDQLVKAMEDHRHELAVIFAGYPAEMEWFLLQNPGLRSRLPMQIAFPDYTAGELVRIAQAMLAQRQYALAPEAAAGLREAVEQRPYWFRAEEGNARAVRNLLEQAIRCQAARLVAGPPPDRAALMLLTRTDLEEAMR